MTLSPKNKSFKILSQGDNQRKMGFSLLELMLVIAVISVLLVISFGVNRKIRVQADNAKCISNLRQTATALLGYASEHSNKIRSGYSGSKLETAQIWGALLESKGYLGDRNVLRCPVGLCPSGVNATPWAWYTYGLNMFGPAGSIITPESNAYREFHLNLTRVEGAAEYILLADSGAQASGTVYQTFRMDRRIPSGMQVRHDSKVNVIYVDGHVETLTHRDAVQKTEQWRLPIYETKAQ